MQNINNFYKFVSEDKTMANFQRKYGIHLKRRFMCYSFGRLIFYWFKMPQSNGRGIWDGFQQYGKKGVCSLHNQPDFYIFAIENE